MSTVRSMTGFAEMGGVLADGRAVSVRLKSVNGRHAELQMRLPAGLETLESDLRTLLKAAVRRGHVELTVFAERGASRDSMQVDHALLANYVALHRQAAERHGLNCEPDLNALLRMQGVMTTGVPTEFDGESLARLREVAGEALAAFNTSREREGAALATELRAGLRRMAELAAEAAELRRQSSLGAVQRLQMKLTELAGEALNVTPDRLLAEAALLIARGDVEEELVRVRTHIERFGALLDAGGEVGKPLEFLLQELNRESNTLLSKTGGATGEAGLRLTEIGLALKVEIERAREQVMNLE